MREPNLIDTYQGDNQKTFPCKKVSALDRWALVLWSWIFYVSKINEIQKYRKILFKTKKKFDVAENVFIAFFLKKCNLTKVSKFQYLFKLLKELIKRWICQ